MPTATASTVNIPIVGPTSKKTAYVVGSGVIAVLGIAYYRVHKANTAAASVAAAGASTIDPATGFAYGTPEDAAALQAQAGYVSPTGTGVGGGPSSTPAPGAGFTSNPQWEQAAVEYLSGTVGSDAGTVSEALGKYLAGEAVTESEHSIITQAIAAEGQPPQAGAQGFPPSIKDVLPAPPPTNTITAPVLRVQSTTATTAVLAWTPVASAVAYHIEKDGLAMETLSNPNQLTVTVPRGHNYGVYAFIGSGATRTQSPQSNVIHV